jgi:hypothetical protein
MKQLRYFGDFGQIVPHPDWGNCPACCWAQKDEVGEFAPGGVRINYEGSAPQLLRDGDEASSKIRDMSRIIRSRWGPDNYADLRENEKQDLESESHEVGGKLERLKSLGQETLDAWKAYGDHIEAEGPRSQTAANLGSTASTKLTRLGSYKIRAFTDLDRLMVYAPDPLTAEKLCSKKLEAEQKHLEVNDKVSEINLAISRNITEFYRRRDELFGGLQALFEGLLAIIQLLIDLVVGAFKAIPGLLRWFKQHPTLSIGIGATLGLLILGLILRPYISMIMLAVPG